MSQYYSIEIHVFYFQVVLRNNFEPLHEVNVSDKPIELQFKGWQRILFKWNINDPHVIKMLDSLELHIIDLNSCNYLAIKEPQSVNFGWYLLNLLSDQTEWDLTEWDSLEGFRLNLECLTFRQRKIISFNCLGLKLDGKLILAIQRSLIKKVPVRFILCKRVDDLSISLNRSFNISSPLDLIIYDIDVPSKTVFLATYLRKIIAIKALLLLGHRDNYLGR